MNDKRMAYFEDTLNELSDMIDKSFKTRLLIIKSLKCPTLRAVISKRTLNIEQIDFSDFFTEPFAELHRIDEDEEIAKEKYSWLTDGKRKKLIEVLDALVSSLISEYTEHQPEFQELKEKFRKIAEENEKEEAQQEK